MKYMSVKKDELDLTSEQFELLVDAQMLFEQVVHFSEEYPRSMPFIKMGQTLLLIEGDATL
jgi:hypothetical protein